MRELFRSGTMTLAAALIGGAAVVSAPALAATEPFKVAQAERNDRGDRGGDRGGRGGGEMRGDRGGRGGEMRSPQMRGGAEMRGQRGGEMRMDRAPRSNVQRPDRQRTETRRDVRRDDRRDDRRYDRRDRRETYQRFHRHRPEYRTRYPFVYLGGPRVIVREYGPGWCRGLHRGYHWAPRIGWHYGTHHGLYRCR
ncbi:MAG: hypothetical protein ACK4MV_05525 [Beijerinckiaceae bacterium]